MRSFSLFSAGVVLLLAGAPAPASAQQDQPRDAGGRPDRNQQTDHGRRSEQPQHPAPTPAPAPGRAPQARHDQQPRRGNRAPTSRRRLEPGEQRGAWQQGRAHNWESEHRTWQQRGGYRGYRIPPTRFRAYFGRDRWFRIYGAPMVMVGPYPRFRYAGYWFRLADPWPESWADDWYERDDVSIDYYHDGYYLVNRNHPGILIAVQVYLQ